MKTWKSTSLCLLLALSLVPYAAASSTPAPFLTGGADCTLAAPTAPAVSPAAAAEPLSSLWSSDALAAAEAPPLPWINSVGKVCNVFCTGRPSCLCNDGSRGTCVSNECTPIR